MSTVTIIVAPTRAHGLRAAAKVKDLVGARIVSSFPEQLQGYGSEAKFLVVNPEQLARGLWQALRPYGRQLEITNV